MLVAFAIRIDHDGNHPVYHSIFGYSFDVNGGPIAHDEWDDTDTFFARRVFPNDFQGVGAVHQLLGVQFEIAGAAR